MRTVQRPLSWLVICVYSYDDAELHSLPGVKPCFIEAMSAEAVRELPDGGLWTYEAKLDGYRCLAAKRNGGVVLWSRRGNGFTSRVPEIARVPASGFA
jgi:ATP-dependent DNA ligase